MKRILLLILATITVAIITGYLALIMYQTIITLAQNVDYHLYQASNAPAQLLNNLQNGSNNVPTSDNVPTNAYTKTIGPAIITSRPSSKENQQKINSQLANSSKPLNDSTATKNQPAKLQTPWITVPKIGINTRILTKGPIKKRMFKGIALITAFGRPDQPDVQGKKPVILASHRFSYVWWTPAYRRTHSFHNIDKLKKGDVVYIRWKGQWYRYKINKKVISATIAEYNHDLILYSCVNYTSKKRIIIYADKF